MIDLTGLPSPENAPAAGTCIRIERPEDGLVVLYLDPPHRSMAVFDAPLLRDLDAAITQIEGDPNVKGVVITGRDAYQFAAGADVEAIGKLEDKAALERIVLMVHELFRRISKLRPTTVAAIGGPAPGGAFEISLACNFIIATDDKKTKIGLPETMLGIIPGWGGCHRLPKRVGIPTALDMILAGKLLPAVAAKKRGMIDRLTKPEYLVSVASDIALGRKSCKRVKRGWKGWLVDRNPIAKAVIRNQAEKQVLSRTKGHYPAPLKALELVLDGPSTSMAAGAKKEAAAIAELAVTPICKSLVSIFFASEAAKQLAKAEDGSKARKHEFGAVIGAGVMGGGIASVMAEKGIYTRMADLSQAALDKSVMVHRKDIKKLKARRRLKQHEADAAFDNLDTTANLAGLQRCQVIVEAVAEKLEIKRKIFGDLAKQVSDDCVLATNTSSLSVDDIAEGLPNPERIVGLHFFNPVRKMPLVEIVRGKATSDEVVREMAALALRLGKTPVVCKDVSGFLVNRILGPYLDEAVRLFVGGADPERLDKALLDFGMPMGPLELLDEVGLDIASHAAASLHAAYGKRMEPSTGLDSMSNEKRLGKKTGYGFYRHSNEKGKRPELAEDLAQYQSGTFAKNLGNEELVDRCVFAMLGEAARCLEENVVDGPVQLDLATVFGTGFAPFRGGLLRYADSRGLAEIVTRMESFAKDNPERFTPPKNMRRLAAAKTGFHTADGSGAGKEHKAAG